MKKECDWLKEINSQSLQQPIRNLDNAQNHKLAQSISDVGWSMFVDIVEYKSEWYDKNIIRIGRFEPSSKICNCCGGINKELTLQERE